VRDERVFPNEDSSDEVLRDPVRIF